MYRSTNILLPVILAATVISAVAAFQVLLAGGKKTFTTESYELPAGQTYTTKVPLKKRSDYHKYLWDRAEINGSAVFRIDKAISMYLDNKSRYKGIEKMRRGGVPSAIIFVLHGRESTWNFRKHLHEGSPLTSRTRWVPKGRPKAPPANGSVYTFEESAEDALYKLKDLESVNWEDCNTALYTIEKYNGLGYIKFRSIHSPYLWAGTNHYTSGKYVADGKYSSTAVDKQLGTAAILKRMVDRKVDIGFK
jgi:lysozyme family protein